MNTSPARENVIDMRGRFCACGCGKITSGYKYIGSPGSTDYNRHAARYSRKERANKKRGVEDAIIELIDIVKLTQFDSTGKPDVNLEILKELQKLNSNISSGSAVAADDAPISRKKTKPIAEYDASQLEITVDKDAGKRANANFLRSMSAIGATRTANGKSSKGVNPKAMDVPQFAAPQIDVDELTIE